MENLIRKLPPLPHSLKQEIVEKGVHQQFPAGTEILREGQYVKMIPLVIEGLLKVYSSFEEKELLLYYIEPMESCVMSFSAGLWNAPSKVYALAEEDTEVLLFPTALMNDWVKAYPPIGELFFRQFNKRYDDLLNTIQQVLFNKMDRRLYAYLREKAQLTGSRQLNLRHHEIARDLGTAREVVSRVLKKLEAENKVIQHQHLLEIL